MVVEGLSFEVAGGVAALTFDRPAKRNAITRAMWEAIPTCLDRASRDADVRMLLLRGAGGHFASGADLGQYETIHAFAEGTRDYLAVVYAAVEALAGFSKPSVAAIEGYCVGGGLLTALGCDLRIAAENARFCAPPARMGLFLPVGQAARLVDAVGASRALDLLYTARMVEAQEALRIGLVGEVHATDRFEAALDAKIAAISGLPMVSARRHKAIVAMIRDGHRHDTGETHTWLVEALGAAEFRAVLPTGRRRNG